MYKAVDKVTVATVPNVPVTVIGQDIDRSLITSLSAADGRFAGDKVMVEINGKRIFSCQPCPLAAELPWEVIQNDENALKLKHPNCDHELVMRWDELLRGQAKTEPAVFVIRDSYLSSKPLFIILQFAAYRTTSSVVAESIKPEWELDAWDGLLADPMIRRATLEKIQKDLAGLVHPSWVWRSACRFALRSEVRLNIIEAFRSADWYKITQQPDDVILRILRELRWMAAYRQHSETVLIRNETTDELKSAGELDETKDISLTD